jgi:hypothetical protein
VIVDDLYIERIASMPTKTNSPLIVDPDTVPTLATALQSFEPVARRHPQVVQSPRLVQVQELPARDPFEGAKSANRSIVEQSFSVVACE